MLDFIYVIKNEINIHYYHITKENIFFRKLV